MKCECTLNLETGFMESSKCKLHAKPERSEEFVPSCLTMLAAEPDRLTRRESERGA